MNGWTDQKLRYSIKRVTTEKEYIKKKSTEMRNNTLDYLNYFRFTLCPSTL